MSNTRRCLVACAILGTAFTIRTAAHAQTTCSGFVSPCVAKAVSMGAEAKSYRPKCVAAANDCKRTGCFVGPTSGITFACNLGKK